MDHMRRRDTFIAPLAAALQAGATPPSDDSASTRIYAYGDGVTRSPAEYAALLASLTANDQVEADFYSQGGIVEKLEKHLAKILGKEAAVWLPTGTLANQLAIRLLCGGNHRRALLQADSHLYRDCGDCVQTLSGITLIPLAPGRPGFTVEDVEQAAKESQMGRVATPIGAIQIETPVRRHHGQQFDFEQIRR